MKRKENMWVELSTLGLCDSMQLQQFFLILGWPDIAVTHSMPDLLGYHEGFLRY